MEHAPQNAMDDPDEIVLFHDRCSDLMRELLAGLAALPDTPRPFPEIEDAIGWPRRRIASVLGGVSHLRHTEFGGRRPYHFHDERQAASGRWELWMDSAQAAAMRESVRGYAPAEAGPGSEDCGSAFVARWHGRGPRNVLIEHVITGERVVRPFRGLRRSG